jgi:hypothetical protein
MDRRLDVATLLAAQAWKTAPTIEARDAALAAMQRVDRIKGFLRAPDGIDVGPLAFGPAGRTLAVAGFNKISHGSVVKGPQRSRRGLCLGREAGSLGKRPRLSAPARPRLGGLAKSMTECNSMQSKARMPATVVVAPVEWDDRDAP